jgi:hypothetical protein
MHHTTPSLGTEHASFTTLPPAVSLLEDRALIFQPASRAAGPASGSPHIRKKLVVPNTYTGFHKFNDTGTSSSSIPTELLPSIVLEEQAGKTAPVPMAAITPSAPTSADAWTTAKFVAATDSAATSEPLAVSIVSKPLEMSNMRSVSVWVPDVLLLKRCNVADPFTKQARQQHSATSGQTSKELGFSGARGGGTSVREDDSISDIRLTRDPNLAPIVAPRPPASLFSAVFGE